MADTQTAQKEKTKLSAKQWGILVTIILMYFFAPTFNAVSSTFALMPDVYGVTPAEVSWITTLANPTSCISGLLIGIFVGRKISYRASAILAMLFFSIFGGLPFIWQSIPFGLLLVSRLLFGLGCGCINPLVQSIITHMFKSETARSAWIGIINIMFSVGASVGSMITGALALNSWQTAYAFYLFALVAVALAFVFVRDKDIVGEKAAIEEKSEAPKEKRHIPGVAWAFIIVFVLCTTCTQTFFSYTGIAMAESGANTLLVGTVFTVFTVAGIVIAAANAPLWKVFRLWNFPISYALIALSYVFCLIGYGSGSTVMFFLASIVMGCGCCLCGMVMPMAMSTTVAAASLTLAIGLQEVARNLGGVVSSLLLNFIGVTIADTATVQYTAILVVALIATVAAGIIAAKYNKRFKDVEM